MNITEDRVEDLLKNTVFTDSAHKKAVRDRLRSETRELSIDELEAVAGGVTPAEFHLMNDIFSSDDFMK